jgi:hypothetical protein
MKTRVIIFCYIFNVLCCFSTLKAIELPIKSIELVHCSHTDYGFTDHPLITEDLQKRYIDIALDAIIASADSVPDKRFYWTAEVLEPVYQWWLEATPERRKDLLKAVKSGQFDVSALPYNLQPFINEKQAKTIENWIPDDVWKSFHPSVGIQDDVNGFPRILAKVLLDKGITHIWSGINDYWGGPPFKQPYAFWWKQPDGRKMLVWLGQSYWMGYNLFAEKDWRFDQREASNTQFRTPRINDILAADEKSVREAHRICVQRLKKMVDEGYPYDFLAISFTNQWRIDVDGPFPPLLDFVKKWNELGLKPSLHLSTASKALDLVEERIGNKIKTYEGEWLDWWAFGLAASPREAAAARMANIYIQAASSPFWGAPDETKIKYIDKVEKQLCRFNEHTYVSNVAVTKPYGYLNQGSATEKYIYAYRPYEQAKWLLAQDMRQKFTNLQEGVYVANTSESEYSGWIDLDPVALRGMKYLSLVNTDNTKKIPLVFNQGKCRFWVDKMPKLHDDKWLFSLDSVLSKNILTKPTIETDENGWPISIKWDGMEKSLFTKGTGDFVSLESVIGRGTGSLMTEKDSITRKKKVLESTRQVKASNTNNVKVTETSYTIEYEQSFEHPRLKNAVRMLEVWKNEARAKLHVSFNRLSSSNPEIFYIRFNFPKINSFPVTSNGDIPFMPYKEQLQGTCTDFIAIDGWILYPSKSGSWIWSSREAPLVAFGAPQLAVKTMTPPTNMNQIFSMVYNNMWDVNYQDDSPGEMEFSYDIAWKNKDIDTKNVSQLVQTYFLSPSVMINPKNREDKFTFKRMNEIK